MSTRDERLAEIAKIAVSLEPEYDVPPEQVIAQWAVESRWGEKPAGKANYFGIKRAARHTKWVSTMTREVVKGKQIHAALEFADYDSLEESAKDYCWLISHGKPYAKPYSEYKQHRDMNRLIAGIAAIYATDPKYREMITDIANQPNVKSAVVKEMASCAG